MRSSSGEIRMKRTFSYRMSASIRECTVRPNFRSPQRPMVMSPSVPWRERIVMRSVSVCVGCWCPPSPALMTGISDFWEATSGAPSLGWRMAQMSA